LTFVDTSAWFASAVPEDADHHVASDWFDLHGRDLITTDYVVDETLTLLVQRGHRAAALSLGDNLFAGTLASIVHVEPDDIRAAWTKFRQFSDKAWSFTDCTSKVVIARLGISTAFAFDHHFRQFGTVTVVP
jgi:predicted nucleic acid-binding protein